MAQNTQYGYVPNPEDMDNNTDEDSCFLRLKVIAGHALAKKDIFGASDPYVRVDLHTVNGDIVVDSIFTKTKKKTLNPVWNEEFLFRVKPSDHKVVMQVFDENRLTRDDFLGMVEIVLAGAPREGSGVPPQAAKYQLRPRSARSRVRGYLEVYHALIGGSQSATTNGTTPTSNGTSNGQTSGQGNDPEWELIEPPVATGNVESVVIQDHLPPLPHGWEERQDANGRTYYVNHPARTTQWERPTLSAAEINGGPCRMESAVTEFQRRFHISHDSSTPNVPQSQSRRLQSEAEGSTGNSQTNSLQSTPYHSPVASPELARRLEHLSEAKRENQSTETTIDIETEEEATPNNDNNNKQNNETETSENQNESNSEDVITTESNDSTDRQNDSGIESATTTDSNNTRENLTQALNEACSVIAEVLNTDPCGLVIDENHFSSPNGGSILGSPVVSRRSHPTEDDSENDDHVDSSHSSESETTHESQSERGSVSSSNAIPGSEGLPSGWTMQLAPNGRMFFIDHNEKTTTWVDPRTGRASPMPSSSSNDVSGDGTRGAAAGVSRRASSVEDHLGPLPEGWEERLHTDGRIFFIDHNTRITQWEDPRLSNPQIAGPAVPYSRDYKKKYEYLKNQLRKPNNVPNKFEIKVRRGSILEDSYRIISTVTKLDLLKTKLWVEFESEVGLDYGGLAREWFFLLSKEMFNPYYGLFEYSAMDNYTLQINPASGVANEEHLNYFKFIGRVAGMAIYHGKLLDAFFIRPFYKMMLGKTIELKDMESVDWEYFNSLMWIKENDPADLDVMFCVDEDQFGKTIQRELKPGGANIAVDNSNKDEYIRLVIQWRFVSRVGEQMSAFLEGLSGLVPLAFLKIFDEHELELLLCGIQHVDVRDWRNNTLYKGDYHANHLVIQWFWRVVLSFSNEMRSRLLQFVTGTSRVPMNGFKELYGSNGPQLFTVEKWGTPDNYPRAHTCFNRLDLPPYESYQQLRDKLVKAIEGSQGFAGVD